MYYSFNNYLRERFGEKVRRISLNAGFTCPNRDGTLGESGCIYCNELGFSPFAATGKPLRQQLEVSLRRTGKKYGAKKFIAYFQNAAGTNASPDRLKAAYDVIREYPGIVALFISTRPDCVDNEKLDIIKSYSEDYDVWIEYGLQTVNDRTLEDMKRRHSFSQCVDAIEMTARRGIKVGAHVILGLPGETGEDMIRTARSISELPVSGVKLHVLHVLKDTELERMFRRGGIDLLSRDNYIKAACDFIENLKPDCVIFRLVSDADKDFLVAPEWINDKQAVIRGIEEEFTARGTFQGSAREARKTEVRPPGPGT
ncbi:MAG: TIGR01212 family radical SAM protein [Candidatus Omnitrophota bacterium]|nr:TIGR01212 family radical SAM protein [Candidatus Omnitrophota bacterium]